MDSSSEKDDYESASSSTDYDSDSDYWDSDAEVENNGSEEGDKENAENGTTGSPSTKEANKRTNELKDNGWRGTSRGNKIHADQLKILRAAFQKDPRAPNCGSKRLADLAEQTGKRPDSIQNWFHSRRRAIEKRTGAFIHLEDNEENWPAVPVKMQLKTEEQKKILLDAYAKDWTIPPTDSIRLKQLSEETGLVPYSIRNWFSKHRGYSKVKAKNQETEEGKRAAARREERKKQVKILLELYKKDATYPIKGSDRLEELHKATGMAPLKIQMWFACRRRSKEEGIQRVEEDNIPKLRRTGTKKLKTAEQTKILLDALEKDPSAPEMRSDRLKKLCAETGLSSDKVRSWFHNVKKNERVKRAKENVTEIEKWEKQKEILLVAFEKDWRTPKKHTNRLNELETLTGLSYEKIRIWFANRRKRLPLEEQERMQRQENSLAASEKDDSENAVPKKRKTNAPVATSKKPAVTLKTLDAKKQTPKEIAIIDELPTNAKPEAKNKNNKKAANTQCRKKNKEKEILENEIKAETVEDHTTAATNSERDENRVQCLNNVSVKKEPEYEESLPSSSDISQDLQLDDINHIASNESVDIKVETMKEEPCLNASESMKRCCLCDSARLSLTTPIVSMREAVNMDTYFGSSLSHFLTYTRALQVCTMHLEEFRRVAV